MNNTDRIELAQQGLRPADETEAGWFAPMIGGRKVWATEAEDTSACTGFGCVDGCPDCAPVCPFCGGAAHAKMCVELRELMA